MTGRTCDRLWEIEAVREGRLSAKDAAASARHVLVCAVCGATVARNRELREFVATLGPCEPDDLELRRLRARILRDAAPGPRPSYAWVWRQGMGAACVLLAVSALLVARAWRLRAERSAEAVATATAPSGFSGAVSPAEGTRWTQERTGSIERVRLDSGTLRIHVRHQSRDERFLVLLPDGQIEVRGTTFEVTAGPSSTERVRVDEGTVMLRLRASDDIRLSAGDTWEAAPERLPPESPAPAPSPASSAPPPSPSLVRVPSAHRSDPARPGEDEAYAEAVGSMTGHRFAEAAVAFRDFVTRHPHAVQAEDASFLEAVALARMGRTDAAAQTAERHLQQFPLSFHRKDAAILVARAARDRGDCTGARRALAPWMDSAAVLAELRTCPSEEPPSPGTTLGASQDDVGSIAGPPGRDRKRPPE